MLFSEDGDIQLGRIIVNPSGVYATNLIEKNVINLIRVDNDGTIKTVQENIFVDSPYYKPAVGENCLLYSDENGNVIYKSENAEITIDTGYSYVRISTWAVSEEYAVYSVSHSNGSTLIIYDVENDVLYRSDPIGYIRGCFFKGDYLCCNVTFNLS